ncbi:MAG TPA: heavy metal-binding domain-containing protein, partial [Candidatus Glassbacteria bacterium]|nr:heavy metal-binding domain-containing protein [Candidatus Glassbacteria bacterium]
MVTDPVCGMEIEIEEAVGQHEHGGQTYYFCNPSCLERFRANPGEFLGEARKPPTAPSESPQGGETIYTCPMHPEVRQAGLGSCPKCGMALEPLDVMASAVRTEYTCPMHPEIVQAEPGSCPICGMALEPRTVTAEEEENPELADMTRRFWVSVVLSAPVLFLAMSDHIPGQPVQRLLSESLINWVQLALATPVVLWAGWPFFQRCWASFVYRSPNMFTLIAIGTGTAYFYSVIATIAPGIFPAAFRHGAEMGGHVAVYFEAAAVITALVLLGQVLELKARSRTSSAIRALLGLAPKTARLLHENGTEDDTPLDRIQV